MHIEVTPDGAEIWHMTPAERAAWEDEQARKLSGYPTADAFKAAYLRGEVKEDPDGFIFELRIDLGMTGDCHEANRISGR